MESVDIIIPYYMGSAYIRDALESALRQECVRKVILVNDGSPDTEEWERLRLEYASVTNIVWVSTNHAGVANARSKGLQYSEAPYCIFLDQDDQFASSTTVSTMLNRLRDLDADAVVADVILINRDGRRLGRTCRLRPLTTDSIAFRNPILSPSQVLLRSEVIRRVGGFRRTPFGMGADDWWLWIRMTLAGARFALEREAQILYRMHGANASKRKVSMYLSRLSVAVELRWSRLMLLALVGIVRDLAADAIRLMGYGRTQA